MQGDPIISILREVAPAVLRALIRRYHDFDSCEDAVQEALIVAYQEWPNGRIPDNPYGWMLTVASRRLIEIWRNDSSRRRREEALAAGAAAQGTSVSDVDDTLELLFLCCHPALNTSAQVALTLRALGGLTTSEIATAFLVPEATMGQRISRAKQRIRVDGSRFEASPEAHLERMPAVLHVLYLIFAEGHTASSGDQIHRVDLTREAIRLARQLSRLLPNDGEVTGLLALMLLTEARSAARSPDGSSLIPLADQNRSLWDTPAIAEATALLAQALSRARLGPYQVQAAIAAIHDHAADAQDTDWDEILELYDLLMVLAPGPAVALNRIVAVAMTRGPESGLRGLVSVEDEFELTDMHRLNAVRAHLQEMAGDLHAAQESYRAAARRTSSRPEQRYLLAKARGLADNHPRNPPPTIAAEGNNLTSP